VRTYGIRGTVFLLGGQNGPRASGGVDGRLAFDDFLAVSTTASPGLTANARDALPVLVGHVEVDGGLSQVACNGGRC
jgi:hypothetical protein